MLKKIFTNDKFFLVSVVISIVCALVSVFCYASNGLSLEYDDLSWVVSSCLYAIGVFVLYRSYIKHDKNVMKTMLGFLLAVILMADLGPTATYIKNNDSKLIFMLIYIVLDIALIINHFILCSDHKSKPGIILLNQLNILSEAVISIIYFSIMMSNLVSNPNTNIYDYLGCASGEIVFFFMFASIVCVESRLDLYKANREGV